MKKSTWINLIFAAVILLAAGGLFLWQNRRSAAPAGTAQLIYGADNTVMDLPLDQNHTYEIDTGYLLVTIQVEDGRARFIDSLCPDHRCEGVGWLSRPDQQAVCVPGHAVLTIVADA